jgi:anaerobic carbon-monoxide dehydrogenase iron sulfur subunit
MKTVFVNPERCIGCRQCEFACAVEHSRSRDPLLSSWEDPLPKSRIHVEAGAWQNTAFPNRCRHCDPAPCVLACPTGAMAQRRELGLVLVDDGKCIACAMCAMVCPFDVVTFHLHADGGAPRIVATKCDGCVARTSSRREPACVEACKSGALVYGELNDLVAQGRARWSVAVLTTLAGAADSNRQRVPDTVAGWRSWGEEATAVAEGVSDEHSHTH